jgi:hypothetical protein
MQKKRIQYCINHILFYQNKLIFFIQHYSIDNIIYRYIYIYSIHSKEFYI